MATLNPTDTVVSQYANSPTLMQMIDSLHQQIDPNPLFATFFDYVWNIETAQGFGLDILGRIINLPRQLTVVSIYPFTSPAGTFAMNDAQYRRALFVKAWSNIANSSAFDINFGLRTLGNSRGNAFVRKLSTMFIQYTFYFPLEAYEFALINSDNTVMRPAGVGFDISFTINPYFGFSEAESWDTFDRAVFASY